MKMKTETKKPNLMSGSLRFVCEHEDGTQPITYKEFKNNLFLEEKESQLSRGTIIPKDLEKEEHIKFDCFRPEYDESILFKLFLYDKNMTEGFIYYHIDLNLPSEYFKGSYKKYSNSKISIWGTWYYGVDRKQSALVMIELKKENENITLIEQSKLNNKIKIKKTLRVKEDFNVINSIVNFLKENKLSLGYTKGTTSSLLNNYKIGLSSINPIEYGLIAERNSSPKPFSGILLNKKSYQKINVYLKTNKISKIILENQNIKIAYDKRLDNIKLHKKYSFQELSKLAIKKNNSESIFQIKDFNNYIDIFAISNSIGTQDYWFQELACKSYNLLSNKYSFLRTNNLFNVILFQEEWMSIIKKITGLSFFEINLFRKEVYKKIPSKKTEKLLQKNLKEKFKVSGKDLKQINEILMSCIYYLPCKAHIVSDLYIELVSEQNRNFK